MPRRRGREETSPYATIPRLLADAAGRDADGVWLRTDHGRLTFAEAAAGVARTAGALRDAGVRHGDLVVITARTTPPYLLCWLALSALGAVTVPTNPQSTPAELGGLVRQTRPRALVTDADLRPRVGEAGVRDVPVLGVLDVDAIVGDWTSLVSAGDRLTADEARPDDLAVLIPTSGTTGRSKLVMQTHRAYAMAGEGFPYWMELTRDDRLMTSLPLFHINAPAYSVMGSLACGAGLVLLPRFSASGFLDAARRHGATEFNAIGAMLEILMRQPEGPGDADTPLRLCYTGPAPTRERQEEIERRFGLRIVCGYAMSESPYGLIWPHGTRPFGTLGTPRQHPRLGTVNEARVVADDELGPGDRDLGPGETGELLLRNPAVTPGYWEMPEETARVIVDGWLHTGDLVTVGDDGTYTFVARKKEVLRRRGENLSPLEVEEVLLDHPAVLECAVVGVPSELSEEEVKAFVVLAPGARPDFPELRAWAASRLAAYKVPRFWQVLDDLPRTPTARVAKHRLPRGHPPDEYDAEHPTKYDPKHPGAPRRKAHPAGPGASPMTEYPTQIGTSEETSIRLLGHDLADELLGQVGIGELAFWVVALRRPAASELRLFEAVLVALADHGFTPTAIAARLTLASAPESVQGALAAGLLGGGSRFLGVTEDCGRFLAEALAVHGGDLPADTEGWDTERWDAVAGEAVRAQRKAGRLVPGLGHPLHKTGDPRTPVILRIADDEGLRGPHLRLFEAVGRVHPDILGRTLPLNGAGVCGAALADLGFPVETLRGFALLARTVGLLGHLAEETRRPIGLDVYHHVDRAARYLPPDG